MKTFKKLHRSFARVLIGDYVEVKNTVQGVVIEFDPDLIWAKLVVFRPNSSPTWEWWPIETLSLLHSEVTG